MSQAESVPADVEMGNQTGVYHGWPRSASNQPSQAESNFGDGSGPLFNIYSKVTEKDDNKRAERWQRDAQGILIFTSLFSIVVAILVTMSVQDLRPRPRDDSAFYLQNIYQLLANPNAYDASNPPPFVITPPAFSPPLYAVWVNSLWFLSLAISLTSALLATLLHQWTRRYVAITQPVHCSPHKRARIRAFFANGVDKLHLPWVVEALPILLHLSLSLFLAGLLIFLFNLNQTAFNAVVGWVALFAGVYACITLMPIFRHDSPFYAPLSSTAWFLYAATLYAVFSILSFVRSGRDNFRDLKNRYGEWVLGGVERAAEDMASDRSSKVDGRVMEWTIGTLCEDDVTERFFEAIPGFCDSKVVQTRLSSLLRAKIRQVMDGFLDRTFSSETMSESAKIGRLIICLNAAHAALGSGMVARTLTNIFDGRWREAPQSIKMGYTLRRWCNSSDEWIALSARNIVAGIIAVQRRDERWIALVKDQFSLPDRVLRDTIPYGDSVLLVILLHVTRNLFHSVEPPWDSNILRVLSQFDIRNTLPQLQHDFCFLWNEIVREAHNRRPYSAPVFILREIRHLYLALHEDTYSPPTAFSASTTHGEDSVWEPSSYPTCNVSSHTSEPPPPVHVFAAPSAVVPQTDPASSHTPQWPHFTGQNVPRFSAPHWGTTIPLPAEPSSSDLLYAPHPFVATSSRPVSVESQALSITSLDIAAAHLTEGNANISTISPVTHPIPRSESPDGSTLERSEDLTVVPSPIVSDSAPPPIPSTVISGPNPMDIPSNMESTQPQSEDVPPAPRSPSSFPTAHPQLASGLDSQLTESIGTTAAQYDTHDVASSTPIEDFHRPRSLTLTNPDISESTPLPEDHQRDSSES
ncbi:hypothetical protein F5888DRAFT_674340 [Russula emetica]|nr:hypothetical protein F5888DRAFT_674340 [Russula emetica]